MPRQAESCLSCQTLGRMTAADDARPEEHWSYPSMKERVEAEGRAFVSHLCIHYVGSDGERTIRTIRTTHILKTPIDVYLVGHCELRNERRVFRASRVTYAYSLPPDSGLPNLASWLSSKVASMPIGSTRDCIVKTAEGFVSVPTESGRVHMRQSIYEELKKLIAEQKLGTAHNLILRAFPALDPSAADGIVVAVNRATKLEERESK